MSEAQLYFECFVLPLNIAVAWAVLLKDYDVSPHISFLCTEISGRNDSPNELKLVDLVLEQDERLEQLSNHIEKKLALNLEAGQSYQLSSFRTHLCIIHPEHETPSDDNKPKEQESVEGDEGYLKGHEIDLKVTCKFLDQGHNVQVAASSKSLTDGQTLRILEQFDRALRQVCLPTMEKGMVYKIETASESDIRDIWKWNSHVPGNENMNAIDMFSYHVKDCPDADAVNAWDGNLTYWELDDLSTKLSLRLINSGVQQGHIVPLCFEKSMWTPVAAIAVMKTGAAFVLLDDQLPLERLQQVVHLLDQKNLFVLASAAQYYRAIDFASVVIVVDSRLFETGQIVNDKDVNRQVKTSDLLYIVFTSGTTGTPKAAMIRHSNICSFVVTWRPIALVTNESRLLAWASYAFDFSLGDIFLSLLSGACLCIPSSWECKNDVARLLRNYEITQVHVTPSVAKIFQPAEAPNLKSLLLGGEQCSEDILTRWRGSRTLVMNCYGPAECTIVSVANESVLDSPKASIVGTGLGACWIMDPFDRNRLSPVGGIGELVLEGPLVGGGYLHDLVSTEAKFFENPEWLTKGLSKVSPGRKGRLYRTGDFVRYTDHGLIEFIGRRDFQVKLRGQRLELGELATHLQELMPASIQWSPEVARLKNGAELLVIFIVLPEDIMDDTAKFLRDTIDLVDCKLRERLQPMMIPGAYTCIDQIPLSLSGKTDHRKMKAIASSLNISKLIFPRTNAHHLKSGNSNGKLGIEDSKLQIMALLWSKILKVEVGNIHPSDTFFSHGGESLAAIKLVGAAARKGIQIDVAMILRYPRLSELASRCKLAPSVSLASLEPFSLLKDKHVLLEMAKACGLPISTIEDAYPCTPMQEGLMNAGNIEGATYVGREVLKLPKNIDPQRLAHAWQRVAATHSIFRTRIVDTESHGLFQVVMKDIELLTIKEDLDLASYLEQDDQMKMGFGIPLCRWSFVQGPLSIYFILTMHHVLYDGWTLQRIGNEVFKAYQGVRIYPAVGFNIFIQYLSRLPKDQAREFWARHLAEPDKTTFFPVLPCSIRRPRADSVVSKTFALPENANDGVSMPSLLRAAWALLIAKLSGSDDVTFGVTVSGRNIPICGIEDLLSPTISTIPARVKLNETETTKDFVFRVQNEALEAIPFETIGLQNIRKISLDAREGSKFQTLFIVHPPSADLPESCLDADPDESSLKSMLGNLNMSDSLSNFNEYALLVLVTQKTGELVINASFDSRVLENTRASLLLDQFAHVTQQLGCENNLHCSLNKLSLASDSDLEVIWKWNSKHFEGKQEIITDVIAKTIALHPDAEAICAWDGSATFDDVDRQSSRLAQVLCGKGIHRGSLVPICMEKSIWATIAMLGIMRAGAGFVALDVRHQPEQRLRTIIEEVRADWIVTAGPATQLARKLSKRVLACDNLAGEQKETDYKNLSTTVSPSPTDTAYIVFTSGSTGVPKGIVITHENFCSTIQYHEHELLLSRTSRIYDFASYSFDIAIHNALIALAVGGCLCVPSEDARENDIEGSFEKLKANWADITPSVARLINPSAIPGLKTLVLSGEAIPKHIVSRWAPKVKLINAYGPAETQICTIQSDLWLPEDSINIGRGVGCSTWIVDLESQTLSLTGAVGELVIEGPIISPGYLNAPGLGFVQNPSWLMHGSTNVPGRRGNVNVYRTGDLARYQADGTIIYVGRATTQVKINGQRVELDEVEFHVQHALENQLEVLADVIAFDEDIPQLCVFSHFHQSSNITPRSLAVDSELSVKIVPPPFEIQDKLKRVLPEYMIPSVFLDISHIPLTATRKFDRQRLKSVASKISRHEVVSIYQEQEIVDEPELNQKQQKMLFLWSQVLKLQFSKIGLCSDFFQLGGDSILAMHLVKQARKQDLIFTVADVLRSPQFQKLCDIANEDNEDESYLKTTFDKVPPFVLPTVENKNTLIKAAAAFCNVAPGDVADIYPCTPFQEGVFALTATQGSDAYVQHTELKIDKRYDIERVLAAWDSVISSNPILRTRIIQSDQGLLMQVVIRETHKWDHYDNSEKYFINFGEMPMKLGHPLSRFALIRNLPQITPSHTIIWTIHHALYDSWTVNLILRQVTRSYNAQNDVVLGPDYNVFVKFLNEQRTHSERWWQSNLIGSSNAAVFPKKPLTGTEEQQSCSRRRVISIPPVLPPGYTIAVLLRCAWAILMARYSGGESVLFGEVHLGRNVPIKGIELMRGPTISSVPVLVHVDRQETIKSMLDRVRETSIQMQAFEHLGMQNISRINEDAEAACKFQTILVLREKEDSEVADSIFQLQAIDDVRNFNSWELMIIFNRSSSDFVAEVLFKESTVSVDLVDLLLQQTQSILYSLCVLPTSSTIQQIDLASEEDLRRIWNWNISAPETVDEYMHELVSKQAQRTPEGIAVLGHDGQMTYRELDEFSSNLASQLLDGGIGVNTVVPLCFEKSILVPVAMLAVIKTGAAFSIMDVTYPESKLRTISNAMDARLIIASSTQRQLAKRLVDNVFVIDDVSCRKANNLAKELLNTAVSRNTNHIMYLCYTSGSTGEPKGVMVTHKNLASASVAQTRELGFGIGDRVYDFSSHAFDSNIWHTWWSLISGACLCIPSYNDRMQNLAGSITSFQTTKLFLTPSVARTIDPTEVPTVDRLFLGGEAVTKLDVSKWKEHLDLWCAYGPTETTPLSIFTRIHGPEFASNIGRGIGVVPWICNPQNHNELMAIGAVGELLQEGPLVTLGYRDQSEKTGTVFIENPSFLTRGCKLIPGRHGRIYKTGDLVRYAFDGTIEYIGRADTQVKLRGQRVEFGEIEFHLKSALTADSSVVCEVVNHPVSERPMLVAFCSFSSTAHEMDKADLRMFLSKRLPPYMLPEAFLTIPEIPKNPSGKINRQYLRNLGPQLLQSESKSVIHHPAGPHTRQEALLEELWATALNQPNLMLHEDSEFFEVGGDSIAVMKLSNLARKNDLSLTVKDIMQHTTLSSMAMRANYDQHSSSSPKPFSLVEPSQLDQILEKAAMVCEISTESISDIYPCTPLQIELFALTMKQPQAYMSRSVFEVPSHIDFSNLIRAWNTVIRINPILRTRFVEIESIGLAQVVVREQSCKMYDDFERYLAINPAQADLGSSLSQVAAISDEELPRIVWTIHHGLYDAWSVQLLEDQLRKAYLHQRVPSPPAYSGFIQHLRSQDLQKAKDFWRLHLKGCNLAAVYPTLPSRGFQVRPCATFKRVLRTSIEPGISLQSVIHAAWALIVSNISGVNDVVFAATLTGRDSSILNVEQMVGATITPVPIRIQLSDPKQSTQELIQNIEQETTSMAPYQHIGTKTIALIDSDTQAACKFQTLLVLTPPDTKTQDAISTSTYEMSSEKQEVFHTFALVLFFTPTQDDLSLEVVFDSMILDRREVERLSGRLESVINILGQGRKNNIRIADVECLGKGDLDSIWSWNSVLPPPSECMVHDTILDRAQQSIDIIAIDAWDIKISYGLLNVLSKNIASHLQKHGVGQGSVVPILSLKSGYVAIAALAVLRVGAAILPLDASQPLQRLQAIVEQLQTHVVLANRSSNQTAASLGGTVLCIQECLYEAKDIQSPSNFANSATPDDIACILWTSGSTGVPKGVMQTHRALSSAILHQSASSGFNETTRAFEFASYSFDVSWNMIFKVLAVGGTLCVPNEDERQNDLVGALNRSAATLTELTASVARMISPDQLSTLKTLIMSGEFVDLRDFEHWTPKVHLIICYGPSECTSVSTINTSGSNSNGIGKSISCLTWIVDPQNHRRLMPVGAVGEILIEGPNVGKGYYNNELETNNSYVSDLPWLESGYESRPGRSCIAFKSGDLARYDSDGNLHFVSRKDTQAKIYGQRIELEEVQYHVQKMMGEIIGAAVASVLNKPKNGNEQRLAVFLSCKTPLQAGLCTLTVPTMAALEILESLNEKLQNLLPKYMIPAVYYFTTSIPRTANGKIDRKRLVEIAAQAKPDQIYRGRVERQTVRRSPSTMAEFGMQRFWAVALGIPIESIGADDDFFNLNGDSISAMRLVAGVRSEGYDLRVSDIFANPKLSDLALKIAPRSPGEKPAEDIPFILLGNNIDAAAIRLEAASKCGLKNPSLVEDVYSCTPLQESMLAATINDPSAFTSMRVYRIPPKIDMAKLREAWETVVNRNRILRTRLVDLKNHGINQIVIQSPISWHSYSTTQSFLEDSGKKHMGLGSRLTRWALIKEEQGYKLVWTIHHTTYDGWSLKIIENEVKKAYFGQLLPPPQPDMRSLVKYLHQQDEVLSFDFWNKNLKNGAENAIFPLLPNVSYKPIPMSFLECTISVDMTSLSTRNNLSALLYGSWSLLMSRITGNRRVTFGLIRTGRAADIDLIDKIVGPTITTVPMIVDMSDNPSVQEFMLHLREMTVRMIPHEHIGIDKISRISAATATACTFQTVLVIQPPEEDAQQQSKDHLVMEELDETKIAGFPNQHAVLNQYGLMLEIIPKSSTTTVRVSFDSKLISVSQANRLINQWEHTLKQLAQTLKQAPLTSVEFLDTVSKQDIEDIWKWNKYPPEADEHFVHDKISKHVTTRPEAVAIDAWDGQLTYRELEMYSSKLAEHLIQFGIGPNRFVPLIFEKSMWANVSMLAVLKSGGTFVPFDAHLPDGRMRAIMQILKPEIILCSAKTRDQAARLVPRILMVDASLGLNPPKEHNCISKISTANGRRDVHGSDLAYVTFSSGSTTGQPKAIKISHTNLATAVKYHAGAEGFLIDSETRTLDSSFYAFDACVCNFFYTLSQGGCLCVPSEDSLKGDVGAFIRNYHVNWAVLVPSIARTITPESVPSLTRLILTGETITQWDIDTWSHRVHLLNAYGPTECTVLCAISPQIVDTNGVGHIGRGRGANLWLSEIGHPDKLAPIGTVGEILIEGPIVGAGYLSPYEYPLLIDPPWLTAGTSNSSGRQGTLFRTGDQGKYTEDGTLIFVGRIGSEIKLRGQRVDIMEIEDLVRRHNTIGVEIVADIVRVNSGETSNDRQMLVLFVANAPGDHTAPQGEFHRKLQEWGLNLKTTFSTYIPSYMHPEAFVPLQKIPKTSSGKTDRRRLKETKKLLRLQQLIWISTNVAKTSGAVPSTPEEKLLATFWAEILKIDAHSIAREDDFFLLGGNSIGVMRLITVAHENDRSLIARDVFTSPKLAQLAQQMTEITSVKNGVSRYKPYSLLSAIPDPEALIKELVEPSLKVYYDQIQDMVPANGFQVDYINNKEEPLGLQYAYLDISPETSWHKLIEACRTVVQKFQCLRSRFVCHKGKYYQIFLRDAPLLVEEIVANDQMTTFFNNFWANDCRKAVITDIFTKISLVRTEGSQRRVIIRMSHLQRDGWCIAQMFDAIATVFNGHKLKNVPDWTQVLEYRKEIADESYNYWRSMLEGATCMTPPLIFKPDTENLKVRTLQTFAIPNFHSMTDNKRTRPTVIINVAWALVLQQLAGHSDIVIGNVTTGRNGAMPGLNSVVGPCVNMIPMRLNLSADSNTKTRKRRLLNLVEACAQQVDERTSFEGLDWDDMIDQCTTWTKNMRYSSSIHFRNMEFEPELVLGTERIKVEWNELVARPQWVTVLVYPEDDVLRLWLLANPEEIGVDGADDILHMLARLIEEIVLAVEEDVEDAV